MQYNSVIRVCSYVLVLVTIQLFISLRDVSNMRHVFTVAMLGHPMEGCTFGGAFILFRQEMQGFGALGMLNDYFL